MQTIMLSASHPALFGRAGFCSKNKQSSEVFKINVDNRIGDGSHIEVTTGTMPYHGDLKGLCSFQHKFLSGYNIRFQVDATLKLSTEHVGSFNDDECTFTFQSQAIDKNYTNATTDTKVWYKNFATRKECKIDIEGCSQYLEFSLVEPLDAVQVGRIVEYWKQYFDHDDDYRRILMPSRTLLNYGRRVASLKYLEDREDIKDKFRVCDLARSGFYSKKDDRLYCYNCDFSEESNAVIDCFLKQSESNPDTSGMDNTDDALESASSGTLGNKRQKIATASESKRPLSPDLKESFDFSGIVGQVHDRFAEQQEAHGYENYFRCRASEPKIFPVMKYLPVTDSWEEVQVFEQLKIVDEYGLSFLVPENNVVFLKAKEVSACAFGRLAYRDKSQLPTAIAKFFEDTEDYGNLMLGTFYSERRELVRSINDILKCLYIEVFETVELEVRPISRKAMRELLDKMLNAIDKISDGCRKHGLFYLIGCETPAGVSLLGGTTDQQERDRMTNDAEIGQALINVITDEILTPLRDCVFTGKIFWDLDDRILMNIFLHTAEGCAVARDNLVNSNDVSTQVENNQV